jgi:glycosyltransferase involved in cell wall biosynthesis
VISPITPEQYERETTCPSWDFGEVAVERIILEYVSPSHPPAEAYRRKKGKRIAEAFDRVVEQSRPDIVMLGRESFAWYVPELCRKWDLPSVLIACGTPTSGFLENIYPEAIQRELINQYRKVDLIVTVSRHLEEIVRFFDSTNVVTILNGVDLNLFGPAPKDRRLLEMLSIGFDDTVIAHMSQLSARKRPLDIVHSASLALKEDAKLVYLIIGEGPCREQMEQACRGYGIDRNFRFTGRISFQDIPQYVNLADMVLMPSEQEGLARAYLETLACARVLIASAIPPAREVIDDGETGLLFQKGDIGGIAAKTLLVARDSELRQRIGEHARKRVEQHDLDSVIKAYSDVLVRTFRSYKSNR